MLVAETVLGTTEDDDLAARVERADSLTVVVDSDQRRRSRFRTEASDGTEVGVTVGKTLADGDVLEADEHLLVVRLDTVQAMILDLTSAAGPSAAAVALGHAIGNRHWEIAVRGAAVLLPVAESRDRMERAVAPHLPEGTTVRYEDVDPSLFDGHSAFADGHEHGDMGDHHHKDEDKHDHH
jgi:urease accessory protein